MTVPAANALSEVFRLPLLPSVRDLLKLYNVRATKRLSQNFLLDPKITNKIVKIANIRDCHVCEVGPGPGSITRSILNKGFASLVVIEKDPRFLPALEILVDATEGRMSVILGDALSYNMGLSFPEEARRPWDGEEMPPIRIVGNLPFNIATPLIIRWLNSISTRSDAWSYGRVPMTLTFQKEVAERIVAGIGDQQRCRLSVMCQNFCDASHRYTIPGKAFVPAPDVDVGVVKFLPRIKPVINLPFPLIEKVVREIFNTKNKIMYNSAGRLFPEPRRRALTEELLKIAEIDPASRPLLTDVEEFGRICWAYKRICDREPGLYEFNHRAPKQWNDDEVLEGPATSST